jgi:hypothetical protein
MPLDESLTINRKDARGHILTSVTFQPSPKMSTYLVAFLVSDFNFVDGQTQRACKASECKEWDEEVGDGPVDKKDVNLCNVWDEPCVDGYKPGTLVRVFAPPHKMPYTRLALDIAIGVRRWCECSCDVFSFVFSLHSAQANLTIDQYATSHTTVQYYETFFDFQYPLPKLDLAAIPDFAAGAMENWGLVTYRDADLLCNDIDCSTAAKQRVAAVIAHELAHQWFGNLVTMEDWTGLWLNEGFANYV